jgi:hypothetical protein
MFTSIGRKTPFYNKSIMKISLDSTKKYINKLSEENKQNNDKQNNDKQNNDKQNNDKLKHLKNLNFYNFNKLKNTNEVTEYQYKNTNYLPLCIFLSLSSFMFLYSYKKQI